MPAHTLPDWISYPINHQQVRELKEAICYINGPLYDLLIWLYYISILQVHISNLDPRVGHVDKHELAYVGEEYAGFFVGFLYVFNLVAGEVLFVAEEEYAVVVCLLVVDSIVAYYEHSLDEETLQEVPIDVEFGNYIEDLDDIEG